MHNISKRWGRDASERRYSAQGRARSEGQVAASNPSSLRSPGSPAIRTCFARVRPCARPAVCGKCRLRGLFLSAWATFLKDLRPRRFSFVYQYCVCACESGASFGRKTAPAAVLPSLFWALKNRRLRRATFLFVFVVNQCPRRDAAFFFAPSKKLRLRRAAPLSLDIALGIVLYDLHLFDVCGCRSHLAQAPLAPRARGAGPWAPAPAARRAPPLPGLLLPVLHQACICTCMWAGSPLGPRLPRP